MWSRLRRMKLQMAHALTVEHCGTLLADGQQTVEGEGLPHDFGQRWSVILFQVELQCKLHASGDVGQFESNCEFWCHAKFGHRMDGAQHFEEHGI